MKHRGLAIFALLAALAACGGGRQAGVAASPAGTGAGDTAGRPGAPTGLVATPGNASIALAFTAPASSGSGPIMRYRATCTAGAVVEVASGTGSPLTVDRLGNGKAYSCRVAAINAAGTGHVSSSVRVIPAAFHTATAPPASPGQPPPTPTGAATGPDHGLSALRDKTTARVSKIAG